MAPEFMRMLQELRDQMQGPLRVSSGRRCDHHNNRVSTAKNKKNGVHTLGQGSDILISGERAMLLFEKAHQIGFSGTDCLNVALIRISLSTLILNLAKPYGVTKLWFGPIASSLVFK